MKSSKFFFIFFISCIYFVSAQQDTLYFDENENRISKEFFYEKSSLSFCKGVRYSTDSLVIEEIKINYLYGELESVQRKSFFQLISSRYNMDTTKTMVIHYTQILKKKEDYPKYNAVYKYDSLESKYILLKNHPRFNLDQDLPVSKHMNANIFKEVVNGYKKCEKYHENFSDDIVVIHFYGENRGFPIEKKRLQWYPDNNHFLKNIFKIPKSSFEIIILQPNGEFYVQYRDMQHDYEDLIRPKNWDSYKREFLNEIKSLNSIK